MTRSTGLWFCFALGLGFAAATLSPFGPAHAATSNTEQATRQLFEAVQTADLPAVQASIAAGADVNARDRWGMTPTDIAIDRGHYRIAHFLVSVRNQHRAQQAPAADAAEPNPAPDEAAPPPQHTATTLPSQSLAPPASAAASAPVQWPAGKANPFDPDTPAPGAQLSHPSKASAR